MRRHRGWGVVFLSGCALDRAVSFRLYAPEGIFRRFVILFVHSAKYSRCHSLPLLHGRFT